jgi:hypothetical protein
MGWENFMKERITEEWIQFIETHIETRGRNLMHKIGHEHLSAPYGKICNGCGNSETISIMLTRTDALRDTNVRNNNGEWRRSGNDI